MPRAAALTVQLYTCVMMLKETAAGNVTGNYDKPTRGAASNTSISIFNGGKTLIGGIIDVNRSMHKHFCFHGDGTLLIEWKFRIVFVSSFVVIGVIGNTLSFFVWNSDRFREFTYPNYLKALAVFDNLTLLLTGVYYLDELYYCYEAERLFRHTVGSCRFGKLARNATYLMSSWMVVCFTVDRYLAVCRPFCRARVTSKRGTIAAIVLLLVVAMISQIYSLVYVGVKERVMDVVTNQTVAVVTSCVHNSPSYVEELNVTVPFTEASALTHGALDFFLFSFTLRFFIPFVVIAACNAHIIAELRRRKYDPVGRVDVNTKHAQMMIYTLYAVCAVFVISLLPHACMSMGMFLMYSREFFHLPHAKVKAIVRGMYKVGTPFELILMANYTFNFVLYGLSGRQFRQVVIEFFTCTKSRQKGDNVYEVVPLRTYKNTKSTDI